MTASTRIRLLALFFAIFFSLPSASAAAGEKCSSSVPEDKFSWAPLPASGLSLWGDEEPGSWAFLFLGSFHNFDPDHPFVGEMRRFFAQFRPTLVVYEGAPDPPGSVKSARDAVLRGGEMSFAQWLAEACGVRHKSFELSLKREVAALRKRFDLEQIKTYYLARVIPQYYAQRPAESLSSYIMGFMAHPDMKDAGLDGVAPRSLEELGDRLRTLVPASQDVLRLEYRHVASVGYFNQSERGVLNEIATESARVRDEALTAQIRAALERGERLFVIAGTSHMLDVRQVFSPDEMRTPRPRGKRP